MNSGSALITVRSDNTVTTTASQPQPRGTTMTVYSVNGTPFSVTQYSDDTWRTASGIAYYLGTDGIMRARGYEDLYTRYPSAG